MEQCLSWELVREHLGQAGQAGRDGSYGESEDENISVPPHVRGDLFFPDISVPVVLLDAAGLE